MLPIDPKTFLDNYILEINPAGYSLFTGKVLEESTGLVYFGARWYDPEVGRFISVDPAEDGENWYALCDNDPVNYFDPDGRLSLRGWGVLWGGLKLGFKQYALKTVGN
ncbi:MAG: RHS repeat-associated core domain-containing protein, partial [Firmicutes bacterium]|nr:RHS repeat-associated core domain-containing protein [Bacillota bacterium]